MYLSNYFTLASEKCFCTLYDKLNSGDSMYLNITYLVVWITLSFKLVLASTTHVQFLRRGKINNSNNRYINTLFSL